MNLDEINSANLDEIILNTIKSDRLSMIDAKEHFGETYTQSALKTDPNSSKSTTEQIIDNNIKQASMQILEYAKNIRRNSLFY